MYLLRLLTWAGFTLRGTPGTWGILQHLPAKYNFIPAQWGISYIFVRYQKTPINRYITKRR